MLRHRNIDRICCLILALTLLVSVLFMGAAASGTLSGNSMIGYENRLFDQSRVHTIDIVIDDWDSFLQTCPSEEYTACHLIIDGESCKNVAIRGKGNTSLTSVAAYGNNRYSFKVEFDHFQTGHTYHGLDKLSLNNLIQDNTFMKDYFAYTLMNRMGIAAPLCSFVQLSVNGEPWGLYLAAEGVEDAFLQRNYGKNYGELYKPDSMSFGGGRGNGRGFDFEGMAEKFGFSFDENTGERSSSSDMGWKMPDTDSMPQMADGAMRDNGIMPGMDRLLAKPGSAAGAAAVSPPENASERNQRRFDGGSGGFGSSLDVKLQYIDDNPASYANIFENAKTDITTADQTRLIASIKALNAGDTSVVDTDAVIRYMAVHNFLCNDDSYTGRMVHNYYLYEEDGMLSMIPWDYNLAYGGFGGGSATSAVNTDISQLVSSGNASDRPMAEWITSSEDYTAQYLAVYQNFIAETFDSGWFASEIDRVQALIDPCVRNDPTAFCTYDEFLKGAETLKAFCLKRAQSAANQLNGDESRVDASELDLTSMGTMHFGGGKEHSSRNPGMNFEERSSSRGEHPAVPENTSALSRESAPFAVPGTVPANKTAESWIWLAACAALLLAAIIAVRYSRSCR